MAGLLAALSGGVVGQLVLRGAALAAQTVEPEDELKAATVLAFLQYARWPQRTAAGPNLTIGVLGRPAMFDVLHRNLEGKTVNGRNVRVIDLALPADPRCCQAYYIATGRKEEINRALAGAAAAHVLTIGESNRFLEEGGAINLFLVDGHMAFEASMAALEQCKVAISSKLLRFGRVVDLPRPGGAG